MPARAPTLPKLVLLAWAAAAQPPPPPSLAPCAGASAVAWSSLSLSPAHPAAGAPVIVTAVGAAASPVSAAAAGNITAFLWGAPVWSGAIAGCGLNQTLNIMDIVDLSFDGLLGCPLASGAPAALRLEIVVPSIAQGMGTIGVIVNAAEPAGGNVFCLNMSVSF
jgi:hypothetical protein